ncbi:hypothetical protein DPEC_G00328700 [Dallia pectoralis]|uniref:Uncharacterized protein n=1 Tax=Dallia pectoralis TaxID=75939 RepID=A0ACC2F8E6_DALPE|nr:hypothetical protein DPEC_G00328700 [Dallia pectoralis]
MRHSRCFLFQMCLSLLMSTGSCRCKPLNDVLQGEDPEDLFESSEQDLIEEEDVDTRLQSFLGNMKEDFLRKLNLSDVPQEHRKISPPAFMIELYNKYAFDQSVMPRSDVIRSFTVQDAGCSERNGTKSKHRMLFNVTVPNHEEVTKAELRLFTRSDNGTTSDPGTGASIKVYHVEYRGEKATLQLTDGKEVTGTNRTWEAFDVTAAIRKRVKSGCWVSEFEVVVDGRDCGPPRGACVDVSAAAGNGTSAALIVFSDDLGSRKREVRKEVREMMAHEQETVFSGGAEQRSHNTEIPVDLHPRRRREADPKYCQRIPMRVNFREIGWNWVLAPAEYDAYECRGVCLYPLTHETSKHALIQALVNLKHPKKVNMVCCVPTKLDPITIMYMENGVIIMRELYEEMKVAACGCK